MALPELLEVRDNTRDALLASRRNFEGAAKLYAYYPTAKNAQVLQDAAIDLQQCWLLERSASASVERMEVAVAQAPPADDDPDASCPRCGSYCWEGGSLDGGCPAVEQSHAEMTAEAYTSIGE